MFSCQKLIGICFFFDIDQNDFEMAEKNSVILVRMSENKG